ncbi:16S rRNA methyltransferase, partial [Thermococci archaeon]
YNITLLASSSGSHLSEIRDELGNELEDARVLGIVGPEGGFSESEERTLVMAGAIPVNLGRSRLRTETASMLLTFLVSYELLT